MLPILPPWQQGPEQGRSVADTATGAGTAVTHVERVENRMKTEQLV